jgi:tRNA nucleotidyltransferase (CCA-adding enzyme)
MNDQYISINIPFDLSLLPPETFLVGGAVRDALLHRHRSELDLDFVLARNAVKTAKIIANKYGAGFVVLDASRNIARVVLENTTLDFAQQEGDCLETDLKRRDFTINAIAYNPHTKTIFDPLNGMIDLQNRQLKMISQANLEDDPLRLLRAYRQAAQLDFSIENNTRETIQKLAHHLSKVAAERIRTELDYLLKANKLGNHYLTLAYEDKLIQPWFKNINLTQLQILDKIDFYTEQLTQLYPEYNHQQNWNYLAKITFLVSTEPNIAEQELMELKYPRNLIRSVTTVLTHLSKIDKIEKISLQDQYFLFLGLKDVFCVFALLVSVLRGNIKAIAYLLARYFNPHDPVAHPQPLVTGNDLIRELGLKPSPKIGKLLTEIAIAHIEGKIKTASEALILAKNIINTSESNQ